MSASDYVARNFDDDNHALLCGHVLGTLLKEGESAQPLTDKDGSYTNQIRLVRPSGAYLITITKEIT
jgi:hypothetical protein